MRILLSIVLFWTLITALNIKPTRRSITEVFGCEKVEQFVSLAEQKHVSSLFSDIHRDRFDRRQLLNRSYKTLASLLDPYKVNFLNSEIEQFSQLLGKDSFSGEYEITFQQCAQFNFVKTEFEKALQRRTEYFKFPTTSDDHWLLLQELKSLARLRQENPKQYLVEGWPKTKEQQKLKLKNHLVDLFILYRDAESSDLLALKTALRALKRNDLRIHFKSENFEELILKSIVATFDAHSEFYSEKEYQDATRSLHSSFVGLGIIVAEVYHGYKVMRLIPGGPADRQGLLKQGDVIFRVGRMNLANVELSSLSSYLAGPSGSYAQLVVKRSDQPEPITIRALRGAVSGQAQAVESALKNIKGHRYGLISLKRFYSSLNGVGGSKEQVLAQIIKLNKLGVEGMVLDLRGNGGGVLQEVVDIAGYFIPVGPIAFEVGTENNGVFVYQDKDPNVYFNKPLLILVDETSASAAEILAGSLKAYNRAVIAGAPSTYGKGTVQLVGGVDSLFDVPSWQGGLRLTVGYYYLPDGHSVQFDGVPAHVPLRHYNKAFLSQMEKSQPFALEKPKSLNSTLDDQHKWMSDKSFSDWLVSVKAEHDVRALFDEASQKVTAEIPAQVELNQAFAILNDMVLLQKNKISARQ